MNLTDVRTCIGMVGILAAIVCGMFTKGCDPCESTVAAIKHGEVLIPEAQARLDHAAMLIDAMPESEGRRKAANAIASAQMGLDAAKSTLEYARKSCQSPSLPEVFRMFSVAWDILKPFIGNTGGVGYVPDPQAYRVGRQ